jgi:hypothetical protein
MSLVGSLEDLGLGDILQIITLSRKSGALLLRSDTGEGRVIFRDGLVCGARVKDRTPDLHGLLVGGGHLSEEDFEEARTGSGGDLASALSERMAPGRFEGLRRECVERAVLDMFGWESGEFSFEVGDDGSEDEYEVMLEAGINAQYLAMEGTRRTDEGGREPEVDADDPASFADVAEEMADDAGPSDAFEAVALTTVERLGEAGEGFQTTEAEVEEALEAAIGGGLEETSAGEATAEPAPAAATAVPGLSDDPGKRPPIVVLAEDLSLLEWVKRVLEGVFRRVHIFQKADLAVQRLRQYVARGDSALVLVSPSLGAGKGAFQKVDALVSRMKKQSPRSSVLWLGGSAERGSADGAVPCAEPADAASAAGPSPSVDEALRTAVLEALGVPAAAAAAAPSSPSAAPGDDAGLDAVLARLDDPATRGEVLNVALDFAAQRFPRVALLGVRDGQALGLAGVGLEGAGGPADEDLRALQMAVERSKWLSAVVEARRTVRAAPDGTGDHELAARLGDLVPEEAWLSPVISGDRVVAILYADGGAEGAPLADSPAVEAVLAKAGEVLEQAMEERARSAG